MDGEPRERVFNAARELFLRHGYAAVSMQQIADAVGIKKASLYYHFSGKEALFTAVITAEFEALRQRIISGMETDLSFQQRLANVVRAVMSTLQGEVGRLIHDYAAVMALGPTDKQRLVGSPFDLLRPLFERAAADGEIPREHIDEAIGLLLGMTIWQMEHRETFPFAVMDVETAAEVIPTVLINGLRGLAEE